MSYHGFADWAAKSEKQRQAALFAPTRSAATVGARSSWPREPAPPAATLRGQRHYYRCADCLGALAVDGPRVADLRCGCGGATDYLGQVQADRLVDTRIEVPCDSRCTNAVRPVCECPCGGKYHGSQMVVSVAVDRGAAPRAAVAADQWKRQARAEVWRARLEAAHQAAGPYLDPGVTDPVAVAIRKQLARARALRSQSARIHALDRVEHLASQAKGGSL